MSVYTAFADIPLARIWSVVIVLFKQINVCMCVHLYSTKNCEPGTGQEEERNTVDSVTFVRAKAMLFYAQPLGLLCDFLFFFISHCSGMNPGCAESDSSHQHCGDLNKNGSHRLIYLNN